MRMGTTELIIVLVVVLVIFGPKQLPKLGKMLGKTMKGFKDGMTDEEAEAAKAAEAAAPEAPAAPLQEPAQTYTSAEQMEQDIEKKD